MSGTLGTETGGTGSGGMNIAQLIAALSPILLGSGKGTTTDTGAGTQTGASTSTTTTGAPSLSDLQAVFAQASANSTNDAATQTIVDNILKQAAIAFGSTKAAGNSAGLYNSTTVDQLAGQAEAAATQQAAQTVLNYKTAQQQIAGQAAGSIGQITAATAPKTTTGNTGTSNATTGGKTTQVAPSIQGGQSLLGAGAGGLIGYSALAKLLGTGTDASTGIADKIGGLFSGTSDLSGSDLGAATTALNTLNSDPANPSVDAATGLLTGGTVPPIDPTQAAAAVGTLTDGATINPADYGTYGIGATPTANFLTTDLASSIGNLDGSTGSLADTASSVASNAADAASSAPLTDLTSQITGAASSLGDTISTGFSDLGNFFSNLF